MSGQGLTWDQQMLDLADLDLAIFEPWQTWPDLDLAEKLDLRSQVSDLGQVFSNSDVIAPVQVQLLGM